MSEPLPNVPAVSEAGLRQLEAWIKRRQRPEEPDRWYYVHPLAPATKPPDYRVDKPHPVLESAWTNNGAADYATSFGKRKQGLHEKLFIRLAVTGGEDLSNSLIFTLPSSFRPLTKFRYLARLGDTGAAAVDVNADGTVVYVGAVVGSDGMVGGIRFDVDNSGTTLDVTTSGDMNFTAPNFNVTDITDEFLVEGTSPADITLQIDDTSLTIDAVKALISLAASGFFSVEDHSGNDILEVDEDSTTTLNLATGKPYTIKDGSGNPLVTYTG